MPNSTVSESNVIDKKWNEDILVSGGLSFYYPTKSDSVELKNRYRVSCTYKDKHTKLLKFKIKTANNEIFSVAAKTQKEAKIIIDELFGVGKYSISTMLGA